MDKLLLVGNSVGMDDALRYAKECGVYTIMTDNRTCEENVLKKSADEYWMTDVKEIDELEKRCREEKVTGIFAATSELCLDTAKELCRRLNLPFYASEEGWASSRDKKRFKKHCEACGLDVPREYSVESFDELRQLQDLSFPIIIKPVDSSAQQGLFFCETEENFEEGYRTALEFSKSKNILVEEFIEGDEIAVIYAFAEDGKPVLLESVDYIRAKVNGRDNFVFATSCSKYLKEYERQCSAKVELLFQRMNCKYGVAFMQAVRKNGKFYFLEMGYRLNGGGSWLTHEKLSGHNILKFLVDFALGRQKEWISRRENWNSIYHTGGTYMMWACPGRIARIEGIAEVKKTEGVWVILERFKEGDEIPEMISMKQIAFYICLVARNHRELQEKVQKINASLHIYNEQGKDLLLSPDFL